MVLIIEKKAKKVTFFTGITRKIGLEFRVKDL
jgi:hypothetical protein